MKSETTVNDIYEYLILFGGRGEDDPCFAKLINTLCWVLQKEKELKI